MVHRASGHRLVADEEYPPFADHCLDLVISCLNLHWVNDLPGTLLQLCRALKPDGLLLASFFGGETLKELRSVLMEAEEQGEGGASPRISPFADVRDGGNLLQRAGFALPVADTDILTVSYESPLKLMRDLRGMAETNCVLQRRKSFSRRETLLRAAQIYGERYGDEDGRVPATFEVITLTGWAPAPGQQQPLAPGSAQSSLTSALGDTGE
jgi:SAM-dependent methyltransferase